MNLLILNDRLALSVKGLRVNKKLGIEALVKTNKQKNPIWIIKNSPTYILFKVTFKKSQFDM